MLLFVTFLEERECVEKIRRMKDRLVSTFSFLYIEVGANTLKSSSSFQLPTKIIFSLKKHIFWRKCENFFWENKAHIFITKYVQIKNFKTVIGACF